MLNLAVGGPVFCKISMSKSRCDNTRVDGMQQMVRANPESHHSYYTLLMKAYLLLLWCNTQNTEWSTLPPRTAYATEEEVTLLFWQNSRRRSGKYME